MTARMTFWRARLAGALVLAVGATCMPASASEATPAEKAPTIKASMQAIVARDVAATPAPTAARPARQVPSPGASTGFFKSGPGMVALVVMVAGTGYAVYSATHDRIHSAGKK